MTSFVVYDVFTDTAFSGNPLAVVPDASSLTEGQLQKIAREFNFSETAFVYPSLQSGCDAKVRIFTPRQEIPFAGHPTIGTATALRDLGRVGPEMTLELGVGPIPITIADGCARFVTREPLATWPGLSVDIVAASIGVDRRDIRTDRHGPVIASVGLPFAIAEVASLATLGAAMPQTDVFRSFEPHWPADTHYDLLVYVRDGQRINARMFAPLDGIPEDPATGSAAAALAAFIGQVDGCSQTFDISQGVEMGRPSKIRAEVMIENGKLAGVAISGGAVRVMEGRLTL